MATVDAAVQHFAPTHLDVAELAWHPFTPYSSDIQLKVLHVDLVRNETQLLLRAPAGVSLGIHDHFGRVLVYTIRGSWRYAEHDWVSRAGDFVYEVANSRHTFIAGPGEDVELFVTLEGALAFVGDDGEVIGIEQAHTFARRYYEFCAERGIDPVDLTEFALS